MIQEEFCAASHSEQKKVYICIYILILGVIDFIFSNDTKVFFLPEVKSPVSADKLFNVVKNPHDRNVQVYTRIEFERF